MTLNKHEKDTFFASPERSSDEEITRVSKKIEAQKLFKKALDSLQEIILILNSNRQIVYINKAILKILKNLNLETSYGCKPGELFNCQHVSVAPNGCGTSSFCHTCGIVNSIISSQRNGAESEKECRLLVNASGDALDLLVKAKPIEIEGETFTIFSISDISEEKRGQFLEKIFFHDILNLAGGIHGTSSILNNTATGEIKYLTDMIVTASGLLIDEIRAQKQIKMAEKGELVVNIEILDTCDVIRDLLKTYKNHEVAESKIIEENLSSGPINFESDKTVLFRVLGNMLKNALEAVLKDDIVKIGFIEIPESEEIEFRVLNSAYIPPDVQMQIFQRSFSTKGQGRGLGTYSMKLLGERYLKGIVGFSSDESSGTCFFIRLKKKFVE